MRMNFLLSRSKEGSEESDYCDALLFYLAAHKLASRGRWRGHPRESFK